jgi:hypothetical protein
MKTVLYTLASAGAIALIALFMSAIPDIRRYLRIRAM